MLFKQSDQATQKQGSNVQNVPISTYVALGLAGAYRYLYLLQTGRTNHQDGMSKYTSTQSVQ